MLEKMQEYNHQALDSPFLISTKFALKQADWDLPTEDISFSGQVDFDFVNKKATIYRT